MNANEYYVVAFAAVRGAGFAYQGSGVYAKDGKTVRVRLFESWSADKTKGYIEPAEEVQREPQAA